MREKQPELHSLQRAQSVNSLLKHRLGTILAPCVLKKGLLLLDWWKISLRNTRKVPQVIHCPSVQWCLSSRYPAEYIIRFSNVVPVCPVDLVRDHYRTLALY